MTERISRRQKRIQRWRDESPTNIDVLREEYEFEEAIRSSYENLGEGNERKERCFILPKDCPSSCPTNYKDCTRYKAKLKAFQSYKN